MAYGMFYEEVAYPMKGRKLEKLKEFLQTQGLNYDEGIEFTVNITDSKGNIAATGSVEANVLKCIAVSCSYQGEGLAAKIVTSLVSYGLQKGYNHLFIFTKPDNINIFTDLGFYLISKTEEAALLENKRNGISDFVNSLKSPSYPVSDNIGAIVLNCNPLTNGHLYLIETAAKQCDLLNLFVVSEDKSVFPADIRYELVKRGVKHLDNVLVHPTSDYLISSATFPTYFIKDKYEAGEVNTILDLTIFADYFAKILNVSKRFVGTEPYDKVTAAYNMQMKTYLASRGIEVIEVPRLEDVSQPISASRVRKLMVEGKYEDIKDLVPQITYDYLTSKEGLEIAEGLRSHNA